MNKFPQ